MDIVYFVKRTPRNEELRYSLRSVVENMDNPTVWFVGGCPYYLKPDHQIIFRQTANKWNNVSDMIRQFCIAGNTPDEFLLFNDDFFLLDPTDWLCNLYDDTLGNLQKRVTKKNNNHASRYVKRLEEAERVLKDKGYTTYNFELHCPFRVEKAKMLEVLREFGPKTPCKRSLYGNKYFKNTFEAQDNKIVLKEDRIPQGLFVSTEDASFKDGKVGEYLRKRFHHPSRFER